MIRAGYELLGLITFFTAGPKEARAWTVHKGAKAPEAAGEIHTDFERGFIRAETIAYDDFVKLGGEAGARGRRQAALRRQGLCRPGRRRAAVPLQRLAQARRSPRLTAQHPAQPGGDDRADHSSPTAGCVAAADHDLEMA